MGITKGHISTGGCRICNRFCLITEICHAERSEASIALSISRHEILLEIRFFSASQWIRMTKMRTTLLLEQNQRGTKQVTLIYK